MHPCLEEAVQQLNRVLNDPSNVPKVKDLVNVAIGKIRQYGDQGSRAEAPAPPAPENVQAQAPETKTPSKKKGK